jgi:hypothetical protein
MTGEAAKVVEAQARAIMSVLGKVEGEFAASVSVPIFWIIREDERQFRALNGTGFFLNTGERLFGVTANHVLEGWRSDREKEEVIALQFGDLPFDPEGQNAIIGAHADIDIATFEVSPEEVLKVGKTVVKGYQSEWPPCPPQQGRGIYYAGFPGVEKIWLSPREISFGVAFAGGVASSVSETDVSSLIEREYIMPVRDGPPLPPENYNFQGISGGPMFSVIDHRGLRTWAIAGVIYQGPNTELDPETAIPGLEIIKARRSHFILPDGSVDVARWDSLHPFRRSIR